MNNANPGGAFHVDKLDADAVCAQCNTVNVEGTLLCKVCGNNLRDQRNRRMQADQAMDLEHTGQRSRTWLSGLLFVLAIGVIIATLVNQEMIVDWLINVQSANEPSLELLWTGDYDAYFQPMFEEIDIAAVDAESAAAARLQAPQSTDLEGVYALFEGDTYLGAACFRLEGEDAYFAAKLEDEGSEVRGLARAESDNYIAVPDFTAVSRRRGQLQSFTGVAIPKGDGTVECMGDNGTVRISFMAYRMPDP